MLLTLGDITRAEEMMSIAEKMQEKSRLQYYSNVLTFAEEKLKYMSEDEFAMFLIYNIVFFTFWFEHDELYENDSTSRGDFDFNKTWIKSYIKNIGLSPLTQSQADDFLSELYHYDYTTLYMPIDKARILHLNLIESKGVLINNESYAVSKVNKDVKSLFYLITKKYKDMKFDDIGEVFAAVCKNCKYLVVCKSDIATKWSSCKQAENYFKLHTKI